MKKIVLRIDDIGASTKIYNQHGKVYWNVLGKPLAIAFFAAWGFVKRTPLGILQMQCTST